MVKIEIISRETIKPSSSTPHHLRTFRLSLLDQFIPPYFAVPLVLYYSYDEKASHVKQSEMSSTLKTSLSDALTLYYPIAGRMKGESSVDCNDEGVDYFEARADALLSDIVESPKVEVASQFIPYKTHTTEETGGIQLAIQVNMFNCGGIAVGICFSHRIADGCTLSAFIKAWAAIARGSKSETPLDSPRFIAASIFPPRDPLGHKASAEISEEGLVTRRFCFAASNIAALRAQVVAATGSCAVQPTRVELVTSVIWKCAMAQAGLEKSVLTHTVNLRGRMDPPLPEYAFGNLFRTAFADADADAELGSLVGKLREGIGKIDSDYLKTLQENGYAVIENNIKKVGELLSNKEVLLFFAFSSWCRFPICEADFGWGKPIWVSTASRAVKNSAILMDSVCDGGIEAWVTMDEEDMMEFEQDPLLLTFVSSI